MNITNEFLNYEGLQEYNEKVKRYIEEKTPQSDWAQTDSTKADFIKNKPDIPDALVDLTSDSDHRTVTDAEKAIWNAKATTDYVDTKVASMVDSAPETLNTLNELAAALGDDPNFATTVSTEIGKKANQSALDELAEQVAIQPDWNSEEVSSLSYIKNKPSVSNGAGTKSIVFNDGEATGAYSMAGGTTDGSVIKDMAGSLITPTLSPSKATGAMSLALGANTEAISAGSIALGYNTTAGIKGYYYHTIIFNSDGTAKILLAKTQTVDPISTSSSAWKSDLEAHLLLESDISVDALGWKAGDYLSIVNNAKYPFCTTISGIAIEEHTLTKKALVSTLSATVSCITITVNSLPFTEVSTPTLKLPDDNSIFAVSRTYENKKSNITIRSGIIELGWGAFAIGNESYAMGTCSQSFGWKNLVVGDYGFATGRDCVAGYGAYAHGHNAKAIGTNSHAEGAGSTAYANYSHAEGYGTNAYIHSSHAEGNETNANEFAAHSEGFSTNANGYASHAEGNGTVAGGPASHAEGYGTTASGNNSHAEGNNTSATYKFTHAEGSGSIASGYAAHAENNCTTASGSDSHAEGKDTIASGNVAHAEGRGTVASAYYSHAGGYFTKASAAAQTAIGIYNAENADALLIVGNGTSDTARSNAFEVLKDGSINMGGVTLTPAKLQKLISLIDTIEIQ